MSKYYMTFSQSTTSSIQNSRVRRREKGGVGESKLHMPVLGQGSSKFQGKKKIFKKIEGYSPCLSVITTSNIYIQKFTDIKF